MAERVPNWSVAGRMRILLSCLSSSMGVSIRGCSGGMGRQDEEPKQEVQDGRPRGAGPSS